MSNNVKAEAAAKLVNQNVPAVGENKAQMHKIGNLVLDNIVWVILIGMMIVLGCIEPAFFSVGILKNIITQSSIQGILAIGAAFSLLMGEIDLSLTGNLGISALLGIMAMQAGLPWPLAIILILAIGAVIGIVNGIMVAKVRALSLMATLAMNMMLQGAMLMITRGTTLVGFPTEFKWLGQGVVFGIPILPVVFIVFAVIVAIIWKRTVFGRSLFAVGGNASCAKVSGINVERTKIVMFMICGIIGAFAGYLLSAYIGSVTSTHGAEYQMICIAAAVIGGCSLTGGRGKILGVVGGVILLTCVKVGLQVIGMEATAVEFSEGAMIFAAVLIDSLRVRYQSKSN